MKFKELSITFHTNQIKECVDFYKTYFQAEVAFDSEWYVMIRLESEENTAPLYLSFQSDNDFYAKRAHFAGGVSLNLKIEEVDACYNQLKETGILFVEEITDHAWGDRAFSVNDPIGNLLYIYTEREMGEAYKEAVKE